MFPHLPLAAQGRELKSLFSSQSLPATTNTWTPKFQQHNRKHQPPPPFDPSRWNSLALEGSAQHLEQIVAIKKEIQDEMSAPWGDAPDHQSEHGENNPMVIDDGSQAFHELIDQSQFEVAQQLHQASDHNSSTLLLHGCQSSRIRRTSRLGRLVKLRRLNSLFL
jgi:hypothetical protein